MERAHTVEEIASQLRSDIIFGRLRPRERLVEEELCERFAANRYVIRTALDHLEKLGLIVRRPNRGAAVNDLSMEEVDQLYEMRAILQSEAVGRIPSDAFPELADRLELIQGKFKKSLKKKELDRVAALDARFHRELYKACGNQYLNEAIELHWQKSICIHSYAFGKESLSEVSILEHDKIIAAIRSGNRKLLVKLCNDHMLLSLKAYKEASGRW